MNYTSSKIRSINIDIIHPVDDIIGYSLSTYGVWEPNLTKWFVNHFSNLKSKSFIFVDIGAHVGYFSLLCKTICPDSFIFAFEPHHKLFKTLKYNLQAYENTTKLYNYAVSDKDKSDVNLYCSADNTGDNTLIYDEIYKENTTFYIEKINTKNILGIDKLLNNQDLIDCVKIDTQGSEVKILNLLYPFCKEETLFIVENSKEVVQFLNEKQLKYDIIADQYINKDHTVSNKKSNNLIFKKGLA